ncbi:MAG TPA: hypothetical protein VLJ16_15410 [Acidobacteriota bacterium]|nr:hypothetical protein [Acidobacteriota bacterium]
MVLRTPRTLEDILEDLRIAESILSTADHEWLDALQAEWPDAKEPEIAEVEEVLHYATHETGSELGLRIEQIKRLMALARFRRRFAIFSREQLDRIVKQGWSTTLAHELHKDFPGLSLKELSDQIKELCAEWEKLA